MGYSFFLVYLPALQFYGPEEILLGLALLFYGQEDK